MTDFAIETNTMNLPFVEALYESYVKNPDAVPEDWRRYFREASANNGGPAFHAGPTFKSKGVFRGAARDSAISGPTGSTAEAAALQHRVELLIRNYRVRAHRVAHLNPLAVSVPIIPELIPYNYGITKHHMDMRFETDYLAGGGRPTLRDIIRSAQNTYCRSIGVQFMHIDNLRVREWLQRRMESTENRLSLSHEEQVRILTSLTGAVIFEEFIQKKYIGAKSFSLEGAETLIPLLDSAIECAGTRGIEEIIIGMPHRGRLNVLANIMGKPVRQIFREFEDKDPTAYYGRGDVKYHLGHHTDWHTMSGKRIHLSLSFNPSHLEFVNAVTLGRLRAGNDRKGDVLGERGMAIHIHGDSSFAGEGVVPETLNLSRLEGYRTGGTLHVIVNNNIGFTTTSNQARSTTYASDVARMLQSPIFHVNGEDPEAVTQVVNLAMSFRMEFHRDVVIDMYCYRRRGHNEGDEPSFTQPVMYRRIGEMKPVRESYLESLMELGEVTLEEADAIAEKSRERLEQALSEARRTPKENEGADAFVSVGPERGDTRPANKLRDIWSQYKAGPDALTPAVPTKLPKEHLQGLLRKLTELPEDFDPHPKIVRMLEARREMADGARPLDWAAGEALAIASLACEGVRVRLTGQDSERGTFSHRHSVLHDYRSGAKHRIFNDLSPGQGKVDIINSPLSESAVLGFEYGYSGGCPDGLIMWEAQFGDFANVAQVYIDQFVSSAEDKWRRPTGLVMLLPHGLEGTGPEHASARPERFLQLAAEDNMQIVNLTTPAQIYHCLRRQVLRPWRKPLIVMAPKSMLRHPLAVSSLEDFSNGRFQRIIGDNMADPKEVKRILLCCGKVYYDLYQKREELGIKDIAILRFEQLFPLADKRVLKALAEYQEGTPALWVQEEPENMGAWPHMHLRFGENILGRFPFSGIHRVRSASPATGSAASHRQEQEEVVARALGVAISAKKP